MASWIAYFQVIATSFANHDLGQITRAADAIYEEYLDLILTDEQWVDRVQRATGETTRLISTFDTWQKRLATVLAAEQPNDGRRAFTRQLKRELFDANPTCRLCNQKIVPIDDAVLDHDKQYWLGGKTVPENAQLAHRLCNSKNG
jgi:hypothetical protein